MSRVGIGYDSHRFAPDRPLVLGGVPFEGGTGLAGHSDADAVLHAVTDAVLGALAAGDTGTLFPDTDERWRNADSSLFVRHAVGLAAEQGCRVVNCDIVVVAEEPRIGPRADRMSNRIAELLGVEPGCVSVKAKTNEGMGFVGRREGLAAMAVVLLEKQA